MSHDPEKNVNVRADAVDVEKSENTRAMAVMTTIFSHETGGRARSGDRAARGWRQKSRMAAAMKRKATVMMAIKPENRPTMK